jgi:DNA topoisomerase VI subunit B
MRVFEGHAFIVEAAVALARRELKQGFNVYRSANLAPRRACTLAFTHQPYPSAFDLSLCVTGDVRVCEVHAFIVEAAVSLGGRELKPGINVYRSANPTSLVLHICFYTSALPICYYVLQVTCACLRATHSS